MNAPEDPKPAGTRGGLSIIRIYWMTGIPQYQSVFLNSGKCNFGLFAVLSALENLGYCR